jgi:hypothetical protein
MIVARTQCDKPNSGAAQQSRRESISRIDKARGWRKIESHKPVPQRLHKFFSVAHIEIREPEDWGKIQFVTDPCHFISPSPAKIPVPRNSGHILLAPAAERVGWNS